ncbi:MAG TPA: exopolysaccharide biosynthesis polyprenyl glycosylphosphotransferase [Lachnospiraceae bacterium]|nr:exopolysaccharide biosynthesis polyprenyl glycosylphosphotransferase [Lachnospiraceae bacterium]
MTVRQKKQRSFDEIKHYLRMIEGITEVLLLSHAYYFIWNKCYRDSGFQYGGMGKYVLVGVYAALIIVIFYLCDSLQFGHLKLADVVVSQCISMLIVNTITYFQLCLISNRMIHLMPMLVLTGCDFIISLALVYVYTWIYHRNYVPRNMVLIYGNDSGINLKFKMDTRKDKYRVTKCMSIKRGYPSIKKEIDKHDAVIVNDVPAQMCNDILKYCYHKGIRTYIVPKISDIILRGAEDITLFDTPLLLVKGNGLTVVQRFFKRVLDLTISLIAMIPFAPVMLLVALAIKIEDRGPVFYKQKRVTLNGREFDILKFRSMIVDAEKGGYNMEMRANGKDPRITKVGSFIRACRIDELPQILNIIKGDMSIVGPRPERIENVAAYSDRIPEFEDRLKVRGGLTGYAQIYGKYNTSAYDKVRLDLMYIENYSLFLDIKLIFMTLQILVRPESTEGFDKVVELEKMKDKLLADEEAATAVSYKKLEN